MDFLGNILSGQDLVNKDYVDKAIPVVPTKLSELIDDILSGNYLPLSGGTISMTSVNALKFKKTTDALALIGFEGKKDGANASLGWLGFYGVDNPVFRGTDTGVYSLLHSGNYSGYALPLSGGTISSDSYAPLFLDTTNTQCRIQFRVNKTDKALVGYNASCGAWLYNYASSAYLGVKDDGTPHYNGNTLIHSGNVESQSVQSAKDALRFKGLASSGDLNTVLAGGGMARTYSKYLTGDFTNAPSGAYYGTVLQLSVAGFVGLDALSGQLAWDVNHNSATDATRYLWWRAADTNGFTNSKWHQIAFTDSDITGSVLNSDGDLLLTYNDGLLLGYGSAAKSKNTLIYGNSVIMRYSSNRTQGFILNSSGNVTIGASDLASTTTKLYVDGGIRFAPRTIWGQSFDGTGNVSGNLYLGTGSILSSKSGTDRVFLDFGSAGDPYIGYGTASAGIDSHLCGNNIYLRYGTSRTNGLILNSSGNVGIGTASPEYKLDVVGKARVSDELIVTYPTGFRWAYGDYGVLFRNDANKFYVLLTDAGGALSGSWNALRPFAISLTTGDVTMGHNLDVNGTIKSSSVICGTTRLRVNSPTNGGVFGFMDAQLFGTTTNVSSVHIGSCYGGSTTLDNTAEYPSGVSMTAISIYRGRVGIGKRWSDTELRALHDANCSLGVWNNAHIMGNLAVSSIYSDNGQSGAAGVVLRNEGGIEITHASTPYIDFHHSAGTSDFSHRLIARDSGIFAYSGNYFCPYGSESLGASSYRWRSVYAKAGSFSNDVEINGALTVGAGATFNGDVRINGNLVVTGDTASGGAGQATTSTSQILVINQSIPTGSSVSQSALDAIGLTSDVIDNLLEGKYHHVLEVIGSNKSLYTISGYNTSGTKLIILQVGSAEADATSWYTLNQSNGGNWNIDFTEI